MLRYKDLDLKHLREVCDIDFAHFTYKPDQCSCCYGPKDLPKSYWRNKTIPEGNDYSYILFKNAYNGSGAVKREDYLSEQRVIYIEWRLSDEQLEAVCTELEKQVGEEFYVIKPKDSYTCIALNRKKEFKSVDEMPWIKARYR